MKLDGSILPFRKIFIAIASIGLLLNVAFDLTTFHDKRASNSFGERVVQSYDLQLKLEVLKKQLLDSANKNQDVDIRKTFVEIASFDLNPSSRVLLKQVDLEKLQNKKSLLVVVDKIYENQMLDLGSLISRDLKQDQYVEDSMEVALAFDFALVGILLAIFLLNMRAKIKIERNLKNSMAHMRELLLALKEENFKRKAALKTTVHDLKNPIGSILGFAQIIAEDSDEKSSISEFSERIQKISRYSLDLVESMLTADDNDGVDISPINLNVSLKEICSQQEMQANAKKQILKYKLIKKEIMINGNQMKIEELLANLINNAIKYSPHGSTIEIRESIVGDNVKVEIQDQGIGFTAEDKVRAFQYGQKLSARPTNGESSSGFGLFMAKQIIELHHGKIGIADNSQGRGACVYFEIPRLLPETQPMTQELHI